MFHVLRRMADAGHAIIFITHKLDEVMAIADGITVLRKGRVVAALSKGESDQKGLARLMVGREIGGGSRGEGQHAPGEAVLMVSNLWARNDRHRPALRGISFSVHQREILGVAGVAGNGQRELIEVLTGLRQPLSGLVAVCGRNMTGASARDLFEAGVAHIPEERRRRGIVPGMSVAENLVLRRYRKPPFAKGPLLDLRAVIEFAERTVAAYGIDTTSPHAAAQVLSGGNLQRLILARELSSSPRLLIASHPTHGLDIGATDQIHELLVQQRDQGAALLLISEDLEEIFRLADRIMVLYAGEVRGILHVADVEPEGIGMMMAGADRG
ncbi:MAG: ATP-binding cassette domain-containing protein [Nitrospinae bacterium]|nr:ATP-binding cassette domain-containing protein [Nitrospinota bacterium]